MPKRLFGGYATRAIQRLKNQQYRDNNKDKVQIIQRAYYNKRIEHFRQYHKQYNEENNRKLRYKVINILGGVCCCCKENQYEFLAIDHIKGGGYKEGSGGSGLVRRVIKEGYPKDKYQILCHNCNQVKRIKKQCTHNNFNVFDKTTWAILM